MTVAWVAVGVAAVGTAVSVDAANKNASKGRKAAMTAAELERQTALDTLEYYKGRDAQSAHLQAQANAIAGRVANSQIALMDQQRQQSGEYFDRLKTVFWPVEDKLVKDAEAFDTEERRAADSAKAVADVETSIAGQRAAAVRSNQRMGVNPNSGNALAMTNQLGLSEASAKAAAATGARDRVEQQGFSRRLDVAALGKGLPGFSSNAAQTSVQAGNGAVAAAQVPLAGFNAQTNMMGGAMQSYANSVTNSYDRVASAYNNQASAWGQAASGFGDLAGSAMGIYAANNRSAATSGASPTSGSTYLYSPSTTQPAADYSLSSGGYKLGS